MSLHRRRVAGGARATRAMECLVVSENLTGEVARRIIPMGIRPKWRPAILQARARAGQTPRMTQLRMATPIDKVEPVYPRSHAGPCIRHVATAGRAGTTGESHEP